MTSLTNRYAVKTAPPVHHPRRCLLRRNSDSLRTAPLRRSPISAAVSSLSSPNLGAVSLDGWIRDSVVEIVKNLRESPLLLQVFADGDGEKPKLRTQKAVSEDWVEMKRGWVSGDAPPPDGLILVEKLAGEESPECEKAWGIVVQGKGAGTGSVCYLLKTCRAGSVIGLGATHFCLVKVRNLRDSALSQLNSVWLLE